MLGAGGGKRRHPIKVMDDRLGRVEQGGGTKRSDSGRDACASVLWLVSSSLSQL